MGKLSDDFAELMIQNILIQPFLRSTGYGDVFGEGILYPCIIEHKIKPITKPDGSLTVTTSQIHLDPGAIVGPRDKVTFEGISPKIISCGPDYDIEDPEDIYAIVIYT